MWNSETLSSFPQRIASRSMDEKNPLLAPVGVPPTPARTNAPSWGQETFSRPRSPKGPSSPHTRSILGAMQGRLLPFAVLFPPLLLLPMGRTGAKLTLPILLAFLLFWKEKGPGAALPALPALGALFLGGYLLEKSPLPFPRWPLSYRFAWAAFATLPWALGAYGFWLGVFRLEGVFLLGGGALALLGFLPLRPHLLEGLLVLEGMGDKG